MTGKVLICGVNWLGDTVMAMPAVQALKRAHPSAELTMLVKPGLAPLWEMSGSVDRVASYKPTVGGTLRAGVVFRRERFDRAIIFPSSFRSALIPFLAGIPGRIGVAGDGRTWMLTRAVGLGGAGPHQSREYYRIAGLPDVGGVPDAPALHVPAEALSSVEEKLGAVHRGEWIGIVPGAARGPSKRWPAGRFVTAGRRLREETGCGIAVLGVSSERALCEDVARGIGEGAVCMAGETSLPEFAAALQRCRLVLANDSGGMHLATAVGTRVVTVFGITDPERTGPMGSGHRVIAPEGVVRSRDVARESAYAMRILNGIAVERVYEAARQVLRETTRG